MHSCELLLGGCWLVFKMNFVISFTCCGRWNGAEWYLCKQLIEKQVNSSDLYRGFAKPAGENCYFACRRVEYYSQFLSNLVFHCMDALYFFACVIIYYDTAGTTFARHESNRILETRRVFNCMFGMLCFAFFHFTFVVAGHVQDYADMFRFACVSLVCEEYVRWSIISLWASNVTGLWDATS